MSKYFLLKSASFIVTAILVVLILGNAVKVSAQTPTPQHIDSVLAGGLATQLIPSGNSSLAFKWYKNASFQYSWDGVNYQSPQIATDESETKSDGYWYSYLINAQANKTLYLKGTNSTVVTTYLIPDTSTNFSAAVGNTQGTPGQVDLQSGANYSELPIITRADWGANESYMIWDPAYWKISEIVVHHTVVGSGPDYAKAVRDIYYYHAVTLGWGDIGYNFLIDPDGNIYEGRIGGEGAIGAHTYSYNNGKIGIAMIGDFTSVGPTDAAIQSLKSLLAERALINNLTLTWGTTVTGHRDHLNNNTECPGNTLYAMLPTIVSDAEQLRNTQTSGTIATARTAMETALASYGDTRLQLNFATTGLTLAQKTALLPKYSGIKKILSSAGDSVVIQVESWSYYGGWHDDTYDRVKMLYLFFSLDPNFSSVDLLSGYVYLGSNPDSGNILLLGQNLYLYFSQTVAAGTGNIQIKKVSDDSVVDTLDVQSSQVVFSDRDIKLLPPSQLSRDTLYYVTVCNTCIKDTSNNVFAGFSDNSTFQFKKAFKVKWQSDYDADSYADITIFDPPTAMWYVQRSNDAYTAQPYSRAFGWSTAVPLPAGDYDGDGKTDIAIFDPQNAHWYIQLSSNTSNAPPYFRAFGWGGVKQVSSGDYDGDGKTDIAIFDPPSARWYIQMSGKPASADPYIRAFGWKTVTPIVGGDYDGDGKTDIAIFDPASSWWYIQMSSQPANAAPYIRPFGWTGVTPIMGGDYDGDGKTDIAIYYAATGIWYIQLSSQPAGSGPIMRVLGGPGQIPLMRGDYDGDGITDIGVYDPQTAQWKLLYSTNNFTGTPFARQFGWSRVIPL